jgi:transmembrane sensor
MFGMRRKARITREAETWVVQTSDGLSPEQQAERDAWRAADPDHERAWQTLQLIWGVAEEPARAHRRASQRSGARPAYGWAIAGAAAVMAAGGGAFLLHRELQHDGASAEWAATNGPRHLQLYDGTTVDLASDSAIRTDFAGPVRAVLLERGSARFDVAHDPDHPFVVAAADRKVTAIGTRFDVALRPAGIVVTLYQGAVEVAEQSARPVHAPVTMSKGQRLTIENGTEQLAPVSSDEGDTGNAIEMGDADARDVDPTAVGTIVALANRGAVVPIRFADPALASRTVEGRVPFDDTDALAQQLAAALDCVVIRHDGTLLLSSR